MTARCSPRHSPRGVAMQVGLVDGRVLPTPTHGRARRHINVLSAFFSSRTCEPVTLGQSLGMGTKPVSESLHSRARNTVMFNRSPHFPILVHLRHAAPPHCTLAGLPPFTHHFYEWPFLGVTRELALGISYVFPFPRPLVVAVLASLLPP